MDDDLRQNASDSGISAAQHAALGSLWSGSAVTEAAAAAGVCRQTVHRWLKEDAGFRAAYNTGRRELREAAEMRLLAIASRAAECVAVAIEAGDVRTAVAVLKGQGLLHGPPQIGCEDAEEIAADLAGEELRRKLRIFEKKDPESALLQGRATGWMRD